MILRPVSLIRTLTALAWLVPTAPDAAAQDDSGYFEDFESLEIGAQPEGFFAIEGAFSVVETEGKALGLPGSPLGSMGAVFGPTIDGPVDVRAKVRGERKGRRYPAFGIGANGLGGFRLMVNPAKRNLEILMNDAALAQEVYRWDGSETWTHLRLVVRPTPEGGSEARAKVWLESEEEPTEWMIEATSSEEIYSSKSSLWGLPYSSEPIHFDDLRVAPYTDSE